MNTRNAAILDRAARTAAHPAFRHPLAGRVISLRVEDEVVAVHLYASLHQHRAKLGVLIAWAYRLDQPEFTMALVGNNVHVHLRGHLDGDAVDFVCVFHDEVADELRERAVWAGGDAVTSIHHLRAVQVGAYRTAVVAA